MNKVTIVDIPEKLKKNVIACFGEEGVAWLGRLDSIIDRCMTFWQLTECKPVADMSYNYICTAKSAVFGGVILKTGISVSEFREEHNALLLLGPLIMCRCFAFDEKLAALLLQRIEPGDNLYSLPDFYAQIDTGVDVAGALAIPAPQALPGVPEFSDWLARAAAGIRKAGKCKADFLSLLDKAAEFDSEINGLEVPFMLLHGDLHHQNILRDGMYKWRVIDPKGVRGKQVLEAGRFVRNQLWVIDESLQRKYLEYMLAGFAKRFAMSEKTVAKAVFLDSILSSCWTLAGFLDRCEFECEYIKARQESMLFLEYTI
ncbi:MAG: hypothetical protein JW874_08495 [Spirochaetales bacterium]|nr:hypothetical protein [Spirochaetales bacterium]